MEWQKAKGRVNSMEQEESWDDLWTHIELWVTMSDVNLRKLVPLEVHDMLENGKIAKKNTFWCQSGACFILLES